MNKLRQRKSKNVLVRIFSRLILFLIVFGIPIMIFVYTFHLKNIEVIGLTRYTKEQLLEYILQDKTDHNTLLFYVKNQYLKEIQIPFIEKIDFEIENNNKVTMYVYEKSVIGCVKFMGEYLYFDKDGIIVESSSIQLEDIPLIAGLHFNTIILNEKLEVHREELFDVILNLAQLIEKYELDVNTIRFNSDNEVTIQSGDIKFLLGKRKTYDGVLSQISSILKETKGMQLTIDMRKDTGSFIAKPNKTN